MVALACLLTVGLIWLVAWVIAGCVDDHDHDHDNGREDKRGK